MQGFFFIGLKCAQHKQMLLFHEYRRGLLTTEVNEVDGILCHTWRLAFFVTSWSTKKVFPYELTSWTL